MISPPGEKHWKHLKVYLLIHFVPKCNDFNIL